MLKDLLVEHKVNLNKMTAPNVKLKCQKRFDAEFGGNDWKECDSSA